MNDRDRLAPVSLTVKCPVFHLVLNASFTNTLLLKLFQHALDGILLICIAIQEIGVDHLTVTCVGFFLNIAALDNRDDLFTEFSGKIIVTLIVSRYSHDGTCTITHHNIIGNE